MQSGEGPVHPADVLRLEVRGIEASVLTGIYSEETNLPQPIRVNISADIARPPCFHPDSHLDQSKNYMDLKRAVVEALPQGRHFTLIEAIADHVAETLFFDKRISRVEVQIVKLAISKGGEEIGITMVRHRP